MDIPRPSSKKRKLIKRIIYIVISLMVIGGITVALSDLEPASPTVDRAILWVEQVKRGDMIREVRGPGSLVPIDIRWVAPETAGRVEKILVRPGTSVTKDTIILELSNPELELALEEAKLRVKSAESQLAAKKVELENTLLNLESAAARVDADLVEARLKSKSDTQLAKDGLISDLQLQVSLVRVKELEKLKEIEKRRVNIQSQFSQTQLDVLQAQIEQAQASLGLKERQIQSLMVIAGFDGVLEQLLVEEGHQVSSITNLAKVSDPSLLKAVLRIDQNQAREVKIGLSSKIDIRSTVLNGKVSRIDPSVREGTVEVDIILDDPLPDGARPDQTLDGNIQIEKLTNILYVGRPVFAQPNVTLGIFKLNEDGANANRVRVKLGRSSVNTVEVLDGLDEGDKIILSDMSEWDEVDRINLR